VLSLAEIHGLIVHLPLLAVPTFALLAAMRWRGAGGALVVEAERWAFGAALAGTAVAVVSGLTVLGEARTELRGSTQRLIYVHLAVGVALLVLLLTLAWRRRRQASTRTLALAGVAALVLATVGGYLGGRMVFAQGVGVRAGGQFAQTARGAEDLAVGMAAGASSVRLGREAFRTGLRCASCHGFDAQGDVGPPLAGGFGLEGFRETHGRGLFPSSVVTDRMVRSIQAWLETLPSARAAGR
jgi:uncharacterized membrane protein